MGTLRFILAAAVIATHSTRILGLPMIDGEMAVKSFFMISGFYMTLVLSSKYDRKRHSLWLFYSNRFLRIYPMYFATLLGGLLIYVAASLATGKPVDRFLYWTQAAHLHLWFPLALLVLAQILIVGIEWTWFFVFSPDSGFTLYGRGSGTVQCYSFNFLPQAWSIGLELVFYSLVPFLVHLRKRALWSIVVVNLIGVVILSLFWNDPLLDALLTHFFPFQLGFFCLGILTYRHFYHREVPGLWSKGFNWFVIGVILLGSLCFSQFDSNRLGHLIDLVFIALIFLGIPFLFHLTKNFAVDRFIGELSYPMYLSHVPVKWILLGFIGVSHRGTYQIPGIVLLLATVVVSVLMVLFIDYPVDRWRQRRVGNPSATAFPHGDPAVAQK